MADEQENIKLNFDSNAKQVGQDVNKLAAGIESTTDATAAQNAETKKGTEGFKALKTQLREANAELQKAVQLYGETSDETIKAAKHVAELKDQIGFAKDVSDSFNPDQKFKALGAATAVAGTGLTGVTAGMALFGDQSKETQAQLLKVQAAMAFSDALSSLSNVGDQFKILKTTIVDGWKAMTTVKAIDTAATATNTAATATNTAAVVGETAAISGATVATTAAAIATNIWNASLAIALAPITLIILAIAGLVLGIGYLTGAFGDFSGEQLKAEIANKKLNKSIDDQEKAFAKASKEMERRHKLQLGLADANGKSLKEMQELEKALINEDIAQKELNLTKLHAIYIEASRVASLRNATDAEKETAKKAREASANARQELQATYEERKDLAIEHEIQTARAVNDAKAKAEEEAKKQREEWQKKRDEENKKRLEAEKKRLEDEAKDLAKFQQTIRDSESQAKAEADAIEIELERAKETPAEKEQREYEEKYAVLEANNRSTIELQTQHLDYVLALENEAAEKAAAQQKEIDDKILEQKKSLQDAQIGLAEKAIGFLSAIAGKNKALQKAAIIAESALGIGRSVVSTTAANTAATAEGAALAIPSGGASVATAAGIVTANNISLGLNTAMNIAATAKALQALGGGSAPSAGGQGSGGGAPQAQPQVAFNNTAENQIGQSVARVQTEQPPLRVTVLESDITTAVNNVQVLENKNTF
jgi:hypothetical protein